VVPVVLSLSVLSHYLSDAPSDYFRATVARQMPTVDVAASMALGMFHQHSLARVPANSSGHATETTHRHQRLRRPKHAVVRSREVQNVPTTYAARLPAIV
jgi:hypothetical protein